MGTVWFQNETFKYFFKMGISFKWTRAEPREREDSVVLPGPTGGPLSLNSSTGRKALSEAE